MVQIAENLEIISAEATFKSVTIFDSCGKLITARHVNATNKVVFSVGLFRKGIYIVQVDGQRMKLII